MTYVLSLGIYTTLPVKLFAALYVKLDGVLPIVFPSSVVIVNGLLSTTWVSLTTSTTIDSYKSSCVPTLPETVTPGGNGG